MGGKLLTFLIIGSSILFGALLFYFQVFAYYYRVSGIDQISVDDKIISVTGYQGVDAESSGLKLRGCFFTNPEDFSELKQKNNPTPLSAPFWFDCFDHSDLQKDLDNDLATAYIASKEDKPGMDRIVAVYPDGRSYQWRQLSDRYLEK